MKLFPISMLLFLAVAITSCQSHSKSIGSGAPAKVLLKPADFQTQISRTKKAVLLDVRTPEEFAEGHLDGALNIDVKNPDFAEQIRQLDTSKTYFVYCRSGRRSITACDTLLSSGFVKLYELDGGILSWQESGKPVVK